MDEPHGEPLESISFEQALSRLEAIVEELDSEDIALDRLVGRYDEGMQLLAHCQKRLEEAKLRITMVETQASGAAESTSEASETTDTEVNPDEIELF